MSSYERPGVLRQESLDGGWALLSCCGRYRYSLGRLWDASRPQLMVVMLNPSTADGTVNDATIVRLMTRAQRSGYGSLVVVNLYAYRATNPKELMSAADPVGSENDAIIWSTALSADSIWVAWGAFLMVARRRDAVLELLKDRELWCLGRAAGGEPRHPLFVGRDVVPEIYRRRATEAMDGGVVTAENTESAMEGR